MDNKELVEAMARRTVEHLRLWGGVTKPSDWDMAWSHFRHFCNCTKQDSVIDLHPPSHRPDQNIVTAIIVHSNMYMMKYLSHMKYLREEDASAFRDKLEDLILLQREHAELKSEIHDIDTNKIMKWLYQRPETPAPYDDGPEEQARKKKIKRALLVAEERVAKRLKEE